MIKKSFYILLLLILGFTKVPGQQDVPSEAEEYALKAVFLYNFSRYVEWIPSTMDEEFIIGVVGSSPVTEPLREIAATKTMKGKKIIVRQFNRPEDIRFAHILFISKQAFYPLDVLLSKTSKGTLTVSERNGAAQEGVAFNFILIEHKLKFEANTKAINTAGLKASSELLKLAVIM
jgi:hypothetical protein